MSGADNRAGADGSSWLASAPHRLAAQIGFLVEADRLKNVLRASRIASNQRPENSAEHSWHLTLFALTLGEWADVPADMGRVVKMLVLHDLVEIDCGDTPLHAPGLAEGQAERERVAADRVFALLPEDQGREFRALWDEFEAGETPDARFAKALDRFQPVLLNRLTQGGTWGEYDTDAAQVRARTSGIRRGSAALWGVAERIFDEALALGWLKAPRRGG